jgi:hypothetical protein
MKEVIELAINTSVSSLSVLQNSQPRDTSSITSDPTPVTGMIYKRLYTYNTLDQAVNIAVQVSFDDGANYRQVGSAIALSANAGAGIVDETTVSGFKSLDGLIRFVITPAVSPTTGSLDVVFQQMSLS